MDDVGTFRTTIALENPASRGRIVELRDVVVDTGAEATWVPREILESLGVRAERTERYQMANGGILARDVGYVLVHVGGKATADDVVFAEPADLALLGARTLEGLNLRVVLTSVNPALSNARLSSGILQFMGDTPRRKAA